MNNIIEAFYMTMELWIFLAVLLIALVAEEGWKWAMNRNLELQERLNAEVDRLHR